jgi:DNA-binding IclR family transcriptional regulator
MTPDAVPNQSVERAARFLGLFSVATQELSLAEITERLGLSRPTVHRYGMALRSTGLLTYHARRGTYSLGPRIIELGRAALASQSLLRVARPHLEHLSQVTNQTAVVSLWDGTAPLVAEVADRTDRLVSITVRAGSRLPLLSSAQGLLFLAFSTAAQAAYAGDREVAALAPRLDEVRRAGVAISAGVIPGVAVVAAPVFDPDDLAGTIALVCHERDAPAGRDDAAVAALREHADAVTRLLGSSPAAP